MIYLSGAKRFFVALVAIFLVLMSLDACKRLGQFKPDGKGPEPSPALPAHVRLHYFFDRTESMLGFTAKGDDSEFVNALPSLWRSAEDAFSKIEPEAHFYEYGYDLQEFKGASAQAAVKREVLRKEFYSNASRRRDGLRTFIRDNGTQPFTGVADYVRELHRPPSAGTADQASSLSGTDNLYIIVTDLYEQNREDPFSRFYRWAFDSGLSAAFFAVESSYSGTIYSVSRVDGANGDERGVPVRDGKSTFFVCIAGESVLVSPYCVELANELKKNGIVYNNAVFLAKAGERISVRIGRPAIANKREFSENPFAAMNFDVDIQRPRVYRLMRDFSRWIAGIPLPNTGNNFSYRQEGEVRFFNGRDQWKKDDAGHLGVKLRQNAAGLLYIAVETENKGMQSGYYKVEYRIIPTAKPEPEWVSSLNAPNIRALEESARAATETGESVKVLQISNVYGKIVESYNKIEPRSIYSGEMYFVKK